MSLRKRRRRAASPEMGAQGLAVIDRLLDAVDELEPCEHDKDGFALWISLRPGYLLCGFCYQAAQVLAADICCTACASAAGDPDLDAVVIVKLSEDLGAHFYLCGGCAEADLKAR